MNLDLNKLENKLDEALSNETSETLNKFLNDKRMSNETKQTAVEWLLNEWPILKSELPHWLIERAIEMEKQQIINANEDCSTIDGEFLSGEQYYNETYGGNK
jgi:hypothetical protein